MPPRRVSLTKKIVKAIHSAIDRLYDRAITRFTGRMPGDKRIVFRTRFNLPDLYQNAVKEEGSKPTESILQALLRTAEGYVDSQRQVTKTKIVHNVEAWLNDAQHKGIKTDAATVLGGQLADLWGKATADMTRIVETEATLARNTGTLDGITKVATYLGVQDPVVYFVIVRDDVTCEECISIHMMPDGTTPRLWLLSEIKSGYHKKGEDRPSLSGLHPNCRCSLVYLSPGFGFDSGGYVTFKALDYDALAEQRKLGKSEATPKSHQHLPKVKQKLHPGPKAGKQPLPHTPKKKAPVSKKKALAPETE